MASISFWNMLSIFINLHVLGGKVLGSVSKKLNILVVGSSKPTKKKIDKAKELNIKIYSENDWYKLLNI